MTLPFPRLGTDMRLLGDLQHQDDLNWGSDLFTTTRSVTNQVDLATLSAVDNLSQALLLRFLTPVGELALLGHPDYGCRLHELIGHLNNDTNRNIAKLFVLQALAAEPRVQQVLTVSVKQHASDRTRIDISMQLVPVDSDSILNLVFPFFLDKGGTI